MSGTDVLDLFPSGTHVDADGMLVVGGCRADDLTAEFGTPVLVVDEVALRRRAREYLHEFRSRRPGSDVAFASKAFPCTAIQRLLAEEGLHLDVAAGADTARLVLHGNAKTDEELELAVRSGVGLVVVDDVDDVDRLDATTHASVATGHAGSKFGLMPDDARDAIAYIERSGVLRCDGCTRTSVRNCSTLSSSPPPSPRWPRSARSTSTTWAAAWASDTPSTSIRPRWPTAPRRWSRRPTPCCRRAVGSSSNPVAAWSPRRRARSTG